MTVRVRRTSAAENDLLEIWLYIADRNEDAADRISARLESAIARLTDYPQIGHLREDVSEDVRFVLQDRYLIVYRYAPQEEIVTILRIVHGSRDLDAVFA